MKLPVVFTITVLCLAMFSVSGCVSNQLPVTYYSDENLTIEIKTNYTGNYSVTIPILYNTDTHEIGAIWETLKLKEPDPSFWSDINRSGEQSLEEIGATHNVTLIGLLHKKSKDISGTESYGANRWTRYSRPDNSREHQFLMTGQLHPADSSTVQFAHLDIKYIAKSNYCSRNNHINGDIYLNGTWSVVVADEVSTLCQ
jgi:hypothetical protein